MPTEPPRFVDPPVPSHEYTELELRAVFARTLGRSSVSAEDDFFDLGGDARQARALTRRLSARYDLSLPPTLVAELPTPAGLCGAIALLRDVSRERY